MTQSLYQVVICLLAGIALIIWLTARYKLHPFFALLIAGFAVGLGVQLPVSEVVQVMKDGFGNIMKSLGFIIVLGTALGVLLEHTGSTKVMAAFILQKIGVRFASLAMAVTGFVVGLPVFCDSGFIVLSGLNTSLAKRTGIKLPVMAVSMASGLYAVHCLIPPHPGAAAAAGIIGADYGRLVLTGIGIAIPSMLAGYAWAIYAGQKNSEEDAMPETEEQVDTQKLPSVLQAFLPVLVPVILIAVRSYLTSDVHAPLTGIQYLLAAAGDPVIALTIAVLLTLPGTRCMPPGSLGKSLQEAAEKAGGILVIIGAGGAFGAILAATNIGKHLGEVLPLSSLGILFPFMVAFVLKTAQGSSTVAIITAASIVQPLLMPLCLATPDGRLLCVLSMGAGSMMISHANDAYFWVIARFQQLEMKTMLKVYSVATVFMGLTALLMVYILSFLL